MLSIERKIDLSLFETGKVAVGVSGGADSLALVLLLAELLGKKRIVALTVDHGLRKESFREANYVARLMNEYGIEHHILAWKGEKPTQGIEEAARIARYNLIYEWCRQNEVNTLGVAHHLLDQAETFFIRLHRGSGLDGLCGMSAVSYRGRLQVIRPFLKTHPQKMKDYLLQKKLQWVEDPSNQSDDYLRVRVRKFLPLLDEKLGIGAERIVSTMQTLSFSRDCLNTQAKKFIENHVKKWGNAGFSFSYNLLSALSDEISFRVLSILIKETGGREYAPEASEIMRLQQILAQDNFKGCTLGNCEIFFFQKKIWGVPEKKDKQILSKKAWDDFCDNYPIYKKFKLPYKLRLSLYKLNPIYR